MPKPRIFISYARSSARSVDQIPALKRALADAGFDTLQDVDIALGEDWEPKLEGWLADCHGAVVFVSAEALASEWVAREVAILIGKRKLAGPQRMRIVPIAVGGLDWDDLRAASTDDRLGPLFSIQGGTDLEPGQIVPALQGLHDFVGLPVGLDRGHTSAPPTLLNVLRASQEIVPFRHRTKEMEALDEWIRQEQRLGVWLLHGPGGAGKTRLALELIRQQNARGWDAGYLKKDAADVAALAQGTEPLLVVIDYAETRPVQVRDLLRTVATYTKSDARPRVRVLLLARILGDWWTHLASEDSAVELLVDQGPRPFLLAPLSPVERAESWREAVERFATVLGRPLPLPDYRGPADGSDFPGTPLYVHMAALDHILTPVGAPAFRSADDLLDRILSHESRYWKDWLKAHGHGVDELAYEVLERTVGTVVLRGGARKPGEVRKVVEGREAEHAWRQHYWDVIRHFYPDGRGGVRPVEPDLLGEHIVSRVLNKTGGEVLSPIMEDRQPVAISALIVLARLASRTDDPQWLKEALTGRLDMLAEPALAVAAMHGEPLGKTLALLVDEDAEGALADRLYPLLPPPGRTRVLRNLAVSVARRRRQQAPSDDSSLSKDARATANAELAVRLGEIGEVEEAQSRIWEATVLFGDLIGLEGEKYGVPLANALGLQADLFSRAGQPQKAIEGGRASILLMSHLKPEQKEGIEPHLAARYNNLANAYGNLGQHAEAAEAAKLAVEHFRHLALQGRYQGEVAGAFGNLGRHLANLGDVASGVASLRVATTMLRALAAKNPEGFESQLAFHLDQLGIALRAQGTVDEAIDAFQEAVKVLRSVRRRDPMAFALQLAVALLDLGSLVAASGDNRAAVVFGRESTALLDETAESGNPAARPELARSLHELGRWTANCGEREAASEALQRAIVLRTALVSEGVAGHRSLALSCGALGDMHLRFGDRASAANAFQKGIEVILDSHGLEEDPTQSLLRQLARSYISTADAQGGAPNPGLLRRLEAKLSAR